jgi:transposase
VVDREGTPLGAVLSPANRHDSKMLAEALDAVPPIKGRRGRPRRRPDKLHAGALANVKRYKAYDHRFCRRACRRRRITPRIARRGVESSKKLGRYRWVAERTLAWFDRFRRLIIRYERRGVIHLAFTTLGAALITFKQITRFCEALGARDGSREAPLAGGIPIDLGALSRLLAVEAGRESATSMLPFSYARNRSRRS